MLKRLKPLAQKKNIELLFESFRPVVAQIDEVKITQVISGQEQEEDWLFLTLIQKSLSG